MSERHEIVTELILELLRDFKKHQRRTCKNARSKKRRDKVSGQAVSMVEARRRRGRYC